MTMLTQILAAAGTVLATGTFAHTAAYCIAEIRDGLPCPVAASATIHKPVLDPSTPRFPRRWPKPPSMSSIGRECEQAI